MVKIRVTEDPNRVEVEYLGKTHSAEWDNDEELSDISGDEAILRAAMTAWDGSDEMIISPEELERGGGGWWSLDPKVGDVVRFRQGDRIFRGKIIHVGEIIVTIETKSGRSYGVPKVEVLGLSK